MSNKVKAPLVPKLRFPDFRNLGEWSMDSLATFLVDCTARVPSNTELPIYSSTRDGLKRQDSYFDGQTLQNSGDYGVVPPNCFVYRHMSDDGLFKFNINSTGGNIAVSKEYPVFKTRELNSQFLLAQLNEGPAFKRFAYSQKAGGTRTRLYFSRLCEWQTPLPSVAEQQKIADCLSSLDDLIAAQARKVDELKSHKKGLMQRLFPREGEIQPFLRFPEFEAAADWEVKKLEDLAKRGSGHTPSKNHSEYYNGGIKWISLADSKRLDAGLISETETEISAQGIKNSSAVRHATGTVLISRDAGVGKSAVMAEPMAVSQHFIVWTCHAHLLSNWFLYYLLQEMKPIFERIATGSTIKTIGLPFFKEMCIAIPTLPEQQRVANCLRSLDDHITAATQELEAFKTHKKGLMQQLFPSAEALDA